MDYSYAEFRGDNKFYRENILKYRDADEADEMIRALTMHFQKTSHKISSNKV